MATESKPWGISDHLRKRRIARCITGFNRQPVGQLLIPVQDQMPLQTASAEHHIAQIVAAGSAGPTQGCGSKASPSQ